MLVIGDLIKRGWQVFIGVGDYSVIDLVAIKGDIKRTIQVKTNTQLKNGAVNVSASKVTARKVVCYERGAFDLMAIVVLESQRIAYVPLDVLLDAGGGLSFRITPAKNNQKQLIRWFADYEKFE